jgi:hypothetical protein
MSAAKCEPGWGEGLSSRTVSRLRDHPTPPLRVDPPPPGEGKNRVLAMTRLVETHLRIPAARFARVVPVTSALSHRGRREYRAPGAPAAACAKVEVESTRVSQVTPKTPGIPRAMVYGLLRALPGDRALLPPSPLRSLLLKDLTPASRRQDHTTSPSASGALVRSALRVHRIPPHVRDDRETPLRKRRDGWEYINDLLFRKNRIFLSEGLDKRSAERDVICPSGSLGDLCSPRHSGAMR